VKSKLQTDGFTKETQKYAGSIDCFKKVLIEDGWRGFWRGFGTCLARAAPVNAGISFSFTITDLISILATFLAFEMTMRLID
jgi:solute carrier family 25 carnitine/acylcarnitine transporter 20/29